MTEPTTFLERDVDTTIKVLESLESDMKNRGDVFTSNILGITKDIVIKIKTYMKPV